MRTSGKTGAGGADRIAHGQMDENRLRCDACVLIRLRSTSCFHVDHRSGWISRIEHPDRRPADTFGLAQLYHSARPGGRGAPRAYAYLFRHRVKPPTIDGRNGWKCWPRNPLGSGYAIAMPTWRCSARVRCWGAGNGVYRSVGFHLYTRLLPQAVRQFRWRRAPAVRTSLDFGRVHRPADVVNLPLAIGIRRIHPRPGTR